MRHFFVSAETLTSKELQDSFIYWSYCVLYKTEYAAPRRRYFKNLIYRQRKNAPFTPHLSSDEKVLIQYLYDEGFFVLKVLKCSFEDFSLALTYQTSVYPFSGKPYLGFNYESHGLYYRQGSSYVRNYDHKPKVITEAEQSRQDWRQKKGFKKDKSRSSGSRYGSYKTFDKISGHRSFRRWEKMMIKKEAFDQLSNEKDRIHINPWNWS